MALSFFKNNIDNFLMILFLQPLWFNITILELIFTLYHAKTQTVNDMLLIVSKNWNLSCISKNLRLMEKIF